MDLNLQPELATNYKSLSQKARIMTEAWAEENLYCPACPSENLERAPTGARVIDFSCGECDENYQLKSKKGPIGRRVANSAYGPKIDAIRMGTNPSYLFLSYDPSAYEIQRLFLVPKHFMTLEVIEKRRPLKKGARREGWVGSTILLGNLPADAKIPMVEEGRTVPKGEVRAMWERFSFLGEETMRSRGWLADVLAMVRKLEKETFTLSDVYGFEGELSKLHPKNKHIRPKIRQQLQVLRDHDVIEFLDRGRYRIRGL